MLDSSPNEGTRAFTNFNFASTMHCLLCLGALGPSRGGNVVVSVMEGVGLGIVIRYQSPLPPTVLFGSKALQQRVYIVVSEMEKCGVGFHHFILYYCCALSATDLRSFKEWVSGGGGDRTGSLQEGKMQVWKDGRRPARAPLVWLLLAFLFVVGTHRWCKR
eukprot:1161603-Pelagomonas_calceolata.AAC.2